MTTNEEVAKRFAERRFPECGKELHGSNFFIRDDIIWSYGEHYPMALWLSKDEVLFNEEKYSMTTRKQRRLAIGALGGTKITFAPTKTLQTVIRQMRSGPRYEGEQNVVFVVRPFNPEQLTFEELQKVLPIFLKKQGISTRTANILTKEAIQKWSQRAMMGVL